MEADSHCSGRDFVHGQIEMPRIDGELIRHGSRHCFGDGFAQEMFAGASSGEGHAGSAADGNGVVPGHAASGKQSDAQQDERKFYLHNMPRVMAQFSPNGGWKSSP